VRANVGSRCLIVAYLQRTLAILFYLLIYSLRPKLQIAKILHNPWLPLSFITNRVHARLLRHRALHQRRLGFNRIPRYLEHFALALLQGRNTSNSLIIRCRILIIQIHLTPIIRHSHFCGKALIFIKVGFSLLQFTLTTSFYFDRCAFRSA
jgi:hypothetical protein